MYQIPVLFPQQTNREDMLHTLSMFDDDTGDAIDFSGRTLANPGDFTAANWTVTDGGIVTNSTTQLTIKDYPFGNEMQAIPLNVGENLGILAGDPVTIADPTGLNTMTGFVTSYVASTGAMVVQIGCSFDFELRAANDHHWGGYSDHPDFGPGPDGPIIGAQLGNGITVVGLGVIQLKVPASQMFKLRHRTYNAAMVIYLGEDTRQLFVGKKPIISGGVSTAPFAQPTTNPYGLP